jgi:hypothetical protein
MEISLPEIAGHFRTVAARLNAAANCLTIEPNKIKGAAGGRRDLSVAARKRIALAQKKRWAKWKQGKKK